MKKIKYLLSILLIISISLLSGCEANNDDLIKELNNMEQLTVDEKLFNDDYSMNIKINSYNQKSTLNILKDEENYYLKYCDEQRNVEGWLVKENNLYYAYINNSNKYYMSLKTDDDYVALKQVFKNIALEDINFYLKDIYTSVNVNINNLLETCDEESNKTSCKIEKKLFSSLKFEVNSILTEDSRVKMEFSLKKGKLLDMSYEFIKNDIVSKTNWEFDYTNQKINFKPNNEYKLIEN